MVRAFPLPPKSLENNSKFAKSHLFTRGQCHVWNAVLEAGAKGTHCELQGQLELAALQQVLHCCREGRSNRQQEVVSCEIFQKQPQKVIIKHIVLGVNIRAVSLFLHKSYDSGFALVPFKIWNSQGFNTDSHFSPKATRFWPEVVFLDRSLMIFTHSARTGLKYRFWDAQNSHGGIMGITTQTGDFCVEPNHPLKYGFKWNILAPVKTPYESVMLV